MKNFKIVILSAVLVTLSACNKQVADKEEAEVEALAYTLYTENSELFVEFKPLIVGETSKLAAHFTILGENFKALTEGTVSVSLIVGDKGIRSSANAPSSPGIYRLALKPTTAGTGQLVFDIKTKDFTDKIVINNVIIYSDVKTALSKQPVHEESGDLSYTKEQAWKVEFANQAVKKQSFSEVIKTSGQILSAPGDEIIVTAKAAGVVAFSGSNTIVGSSVKTGSSLFTISGGDMTESNIDAIVKEAKANYQKAKVDFERSKSLAEDKIVSQKEFQQVRLEYENARTAYHTVSKNYSSKGQNIPSPMTGFIKSILVTEGQFVPSGTPLAIISKNKRLMLQANVSQNNFSKLSMITSANFKTTDGEQVYSTDELNGRVIAYGKSAVAGSPFIPVVFEIDNKGLVSGSAVEVYLKSSAILDALVIPATALIEEQGNFYAYVQTGGESFQKRELKLGASDGQHVQVLSGIAENERVVTKGAYQIKLSTASGALPAHGHEH